MESKGGTASINSDELKKIALEELEKLRKLPIEEKNKLVRKARQRSYKDIVNYANTVNFADEDGSKSFYWQSRKQGVFESQSKEATVRQTEKILEAEYPKMRKEIPESGTQNKYGNGARKLKLMSLKKWSS